MVYGGHVAAGVDKKSTRHGDESHESLLSACAIRARGCHRRRAVSESGGGQDSHGIKRKSVYVCRPRRNEKD